MQITNYKLGNNVITTGFQRKEVRVPLEMFSFRLFLPITFRGAPGG
jgi:hypothetical protein